MAVLKAVLLIGVLVFCGAQLLVGFYGFEAWLGTGWAWAAMAACLLLRTTWPITIASFFGALNVLGWHWLLALLFAAPGLLLAVTGIATLLVGAIRTRRA